MVLPFNPETVELVFSPRWFYGIDSIFEGLSALTALLIAFYSYRVYKFTKKSNYKWFSVSLLLISLAFFAKIFTDIAMYFPTISSITLGTFFLTCTIMKQSNILYILGHLAYRFLLLAGFFGVYWLISKSRERNKIPLLLFFIFATTLLSAYAYPAFSMAMVVLSGHIVYYYSLNYKKHKNIKTALILSSFILIFLSQILFIFLFLNLGVYVASEVLQLAGYLLLLYSYYLLVKRD